MSTLELSLKQFSDAHFEMDRRIKVYINTKTGTEMASEDIRRDLMDSSASSLKAINAKSRVLVAREFWTHVRNYVKLVRRTHVYFVTLILKEHAVPLDRAAGFDVRACKKATRKLLKGFGYIGFIEPAFYYRVPFAEDSSQPYICWHTHSIVLLGTLAELEKRAAAYNASHECFVPNCPAVHIRTLTPDAAAPYALYMSKSILREYTAYPRKREVIDPDTGEFLRIVTGKWFNRKRDARMGNLVRAQLMMNGRTLRQLTFAGGPQVNARKNILKRARKAARVEEKRAAEHRHMLIFGPNSE